MFFVFVIANLLYEYCLLQHIFQCSEPITFDQLFVKLLREDIEYVIFSNAIEKYEFILFQIINLWK